MVLLPALVLAGCQLRRAPAPESTRQLRVAGVRRIVDQPVLSPAAWSPDGERVAFGDGTALYVAIPGGAPRKIAPAEVATSVSWSSALDHLAVVDRGVLWTARPDGSQRRRVDLDGFVTAAVWAPGGDRLAATVRTLVAGRSEVSLWLLSLDGGFRRLITRAPSGMTMRDLQWFPNGLYLLYGLSRPSDALASEVWQVRIAYPDRRQIPVESPAMMVRLDPTGRAIAYLTGDALDDGRGQIVVTWLDGRGRFVVTPQPGRYSGLAWSPQGDKLAYAEVKDEAHAEIWIADRDGSGRLQVYRYAMEFSDPSITLSLLWSPDGRRLLFGTNSGTFQGPIWMASFARQ